MAAELDDKPEQFSAAALRLDDIQHVFQSQGLKVQPVGGVVVGADSLGVAVHHDRFISHFLEGHRRMNAAVVKFDALADPVRPPAEDHHFLPVGRTAFAFGLIGRVEIRSQGLEFGPTRIDAFKGWVHVAALPMATEIRLRDPQQLCEPMIRESDLFHLPEHIL